MRLTNLLTLTVLSLISCVLIQAQDNSSKPPSKMVASAASSPAVAVKPQQKTSTAKSTAAKKATPAPLPQAEVDAAVQQLEDAYVAAYNRGDAKAVADLYAEDATILGEYGAMGIGREAIQHTLTFAFSQSARPKIENKPRHSEAITKDVIVLHGTSHIMPADPTVPALDSLYTKVLVRRAGQWRIAAVQMAQPNPWSVSFPDTKIGESAPPQTVKLTNISESPLKMGKFFVNGKAGTDFIESNTCGDSIAPSGSCEVNFTFRPLAAGRRTAELSFWDDAASGRHAVKLRGMGISE